MYEAFKNLLYATCLWPIEIQQLKTGAFNSLSLFTSSYVLHNNHNACLALQQEVCRKDPYTVECSTRVIHQ